MKKSISLLCIIMCIGCAGFSQNNSSPNNKNQKDSVTTTVGAGDISTPGNSTSSDSSLKSNGTNGLDRTTGQPSVTKKHPMHKKRDNVPVTSNGTNGIDRSASDSASGTQKN